MWWMRGITLQRGGGTAWSWSGTHCGVFCHQHGAIGTGRSWSTQTAKVLCIHSTCLLMAEGNTYSHRPSIALQKATQRRRSPATMSRCHLWLSHKYHSHLGQSQSNRVFASVVPPTPPPTQTPTHHRREGWMDRLMARLGEMGRGGVPFLSPRWKCKRTTAL